MNQAGEKADSQNESQSSIKRQSKSRNPQPNFLSRVFESNTEEECSPMERDEFGKNIIQKGRWFNSGGSQPNQNHKQGLKKTKTDELNTVNEEAEENHDKNERKISKEEENGERRNSYQNPFVPVKVSKFKTLNTGENFIEVDEGGNDQSIEKAMKEKTQAMTKEEQRKAIEEALLKELEGISSKSLSEESENSQSFTNKDYQPDFKDFNEQNSPKEEPRSRFSPNNSKIGKNKTRDSNNDSVPFKESRSNTLIKLENLSGEYEFDREKRRRRCENEMQKRLESVKRNNLTHGVFKTNNESKNTILEYSNNTDQGKNLSIIQRNTNQSVDKSKSIIKLESLMSKESQSRESPDPQKKYNNRILDGLEIAKSHDLFNGSPRSPENKSFTIKIDSMDSQKFEVKDLEHRKQFGEEFQKQLDKINAYNLSQSQSPNQSVMSIPFQFGEMDAISEFNKSSNIQRS